MTKMKRISKRKMMMVDVIMKWLMMMKGEGYYIAPGMIRGATHSWKGILILNRYKKGTKKRLRGGHGQDIFKQDDALYNLMTKGYYNWINNIYNVY